MNLEKIKSLKIKNLETSEEFEPSSVVIDKENNIYVADSKNDCIRKISNEKVSLLVGGDYGYQDGKFEEAKFHLPYILSFDDEQQKIFVYDKHNRNKFRVIY